MTKSLADLSSNSNGRLNLRSFGLVLDGWYLPQIIGWTRSGHLILKRKFLILKSEEFISNRLEIFQSTILPWLYPDNPKFLHSLKINNNVLPKVQNTKHQKSSASQLSSHMKWRLYQFYNSIYPIEEYLYELQVRSYAKIVPEIKKKSRKNVEKWWKEYVKEDAEV